MRSDRTVYSRYSRPSRSVRGSNYDDYFLGGSSRSSLMNARHQESARMGFGGEGGTRLDTDLISPMFGRRGAIGGMHGPGDFMGGMNELHYLGGLNSFDGIDFLDDFAAINLGGGNQARFRNGLGGLQHGHALHDGGSWFSDGNERRGSPENGMPMFGMRQGQEMPLSNTMTMGGMDPRVGMAMGLGHGEDAPRQSSRESMLNQRRQSNHLSALRQPPRSIRSPRLSPYRGDSRNDLNLQTMDRSTMPSGSTQMHQRQSNYCQPYVEDCESAVGSLLEAGYTVEEIVQFGQNPNLDDGHNHGRARHPSGGGRNRGNGGGGCSRSDGGGIGGRRGCI